MNFIKLKIFYRNLKRDKLISIINAVGLIVGMVSALFILEYVYYQKSYDNHHLNGEDIYRVAYNRYENDKVLWETANSFPPTGEWLKAHYSDVVNHTRITPKHEITISYENISKARVIYSEDRTYYATASFFEVFTIPMIIGEQDALKAPNTVAISNTASKRYFGEEVNPIGKSIKVNGTEDYTVTAVYERMPENSILKTDFLFSMETLYKQSPRIRNSWGYDYGTTFIQLKPDSDYKTIEKVALPEMIATNYKKRLDAQNRRDVYYLQPLQSIHLNSNIEYETEPPVNGKIIDILFGFSIFLLIIAWINFINLTTARSIERANEVGVKKINGATKIQLLVQFLSEAFLFNILCLVVTIILFYALNPSFKAITKIGDFHLFEHHNFLTTFTILFVLGIIASCIYPAIVLQSYKPVTVLKGNFKNKREGVIFRKLLVTLQFVISVILLCGTFIAYKQATFLMEKDMGINYEQSVVVKAPKTGEKQSQLRNKILLMKNDLKQLPEVRDFTFTSDIPGQEIQHWFGCRRKGTDASKNHAFFQLSVDDQFIDFFDVKLLAGRPFRKGERENANKSIIMNKKAMERLGFKSPEEAVDSYVVNRGGEYKIVGVTEDFHYYSIKNEPVPTVIRLTDRHKAFLILKVNSKNDYSSEISTKIKTIFNSYFPEQPFDYLILENKIEQNLKPDRTFLFVFGLFSVLAIIIAIIGFMGLILITINHRVKEIGVRKVLGAKFKSVYRLLTKEVIGQVVIGVLIAIPLAWYGYKHWFLDTYIDSIELRVWMFLVPVVLLLLIILSVIYLITLKAYKMTMSEVLQNE
ncbi:ABC transporter permease [Seonamhaeicola sp. ML3]|uniref:ABC transporter permease n=1 Tax=Seonamhaeicola sp. ML3 TaxID=2937786 RepID=UPI00200F873E|nr:ABC transporter permease [Seonamhaeicola sp. ML3]